VLFWPAADFDQLLAGPPADRSTGWFRLRHRVR
jgi:hypothetical protein